MKLTNIHLYNYVLVYAENCDLYLKKNSEEVIIRHGEIAIIEKNISFDVKFIRKKDGSLYQSLDLSDEILSSLRDVIEPIVKIPTESFVVKRNFVDRIFKIKSCAVSIDFLGKLIFGNSGELSMIYKLAYLVSKCENILNFALSLYSSASVSFKEKINKILFADISKKWKISEIADKLHLSEICVRKKLDAEKISFNQLLLDARMYKAVKFIIKSDNQIGTISNLVGYSSISYFIKTFKEYYGVTPKQFEMGVKQNILFSAA